MATTWFTVVCPGMVSDDEDCGYEHDVMVEVASGEWYGEDADGNRGVWMPAYIEAIHVPTVCPNCSTTYSGAQRAEMAQDVRREFAQEAKRAHA